MELEDPAKWQEATRVKGKAGSRHIGLQDEVPYHSSRRRGKLDTLSSLFVVVSS
jgi:hypothetical protein